jgi:hypothetical protein
MGWNCVESPWSKQTVCEEVIDGGAFTFPSLGFCLESGCEKTFDSGPCYEPAFDPIPTSTAASTVVVNPDFLIYGCTNPFDTNYNRDATVDDGSCSGGIISTEVNIS